ncbi:MAG TPA: nuclear transport factor 2 family protein [Pyrinomonadaceae bacterium]|nr:nuclear transport factor 2 family protein [Pyrinomonadaceae bacterium]
MTNAIRPETVADEILKLERSALDRWGAGDPAGFLELYAEDVTYFDPLTARRIDGQQAMTDYYQPWIGKIQIPRYELLNPQVVIEGDLALLTYNLVNYLFDEKGSEAIGSQWNSTVAYRRRGGEWKTVHSHWSFTRHPAFQELTPASSEGLES